MSDDTGGGQCGGDRSSVLSGTLVPDLARVLAAVAAAGDAEAVAAAATTQALAVLNPDVVSLSLLDAMEGVLGVVGAAGLGATDAGRFADGCAWRPRRRGRSGRHRPHRFGVELRGDPAALAVQFLFERGTAAAGGRGAGPGGVGAQRGGLGGGVVDAELGVDRQDFAFCVILLKLIVARSVRCAASSGGGARHGTLRA